MKPTGHLVPDQVRRKARTHEQVGRCITVRETGQEDCSGMVVTCMTELGQTAMDVLIPKKLDGQIPGSRIRSILDNFYKQAPEKCIRILFEFSRVEHGRCTSPTPLDSVRHAGISEACRGCPKRTFDIASGTPCVLPGTDDDFTQFLLIPVLAK